MSHQTQAGTHQEQWFGEKCVLERLIWQKPQSAGQVCAWQCMLPSQLAYFYLSFSHPSTLHWISHQSLPHLCPAFLLLSSPAVEHVTRLTFPNRYQIGRGLVPRRVNWWWVKIDEIVAEKSRTLCPLSNQFPWLPFLFPSRKFSSSCLTHFSHPRDP